MLTSVLTKELVYVNTRYLMAAISYFSLHTPIPLNCLWFHFSLPLQQWFFYQNVTQVWQIFPSRHMSLQNSNIYSVISPAAAYTVIWSWNFFGYKEPVLFLIWSYFLISIILDTRDEKNHQQNLRFLFCFYQKVSGYS